MRNVLTIPCDGLDTLIIASDNSGGIGMKKDDLVQVPYETVAYFSFRVAVMECMAAGGEPVSVVLDNFCGNEAWNKLVNGIEKGLEELSLNHIPITGSTESNFLLRQSAIGMMVLGKKSGNILGEHAFSEHTKIAIIGQPLVGNEVIDKADQIAPLSLFQMVSRMDEVIAWPVGSRGILYELNRIFKNKKSLKDRVVTVVDLLKSSGPSTCFIAVYHDSQEEELKKLTGGYFHSAQIFE